ncbi:hypothetical protein [Stenotrophomonas bentonitica]
MKKIIKNETTVGLIEEMLRIGLNNDEDRLRHEYQIAHDLAHGLLSAVEPHDINVVDVGWFENEAKRGLQFYAVMLGQEKGTRKNSAGRKLFVKFDGKKVRVERIEELTLFVLFQKCRRLQCYPLYEKKLLREMFKPESTINPGRSVIAQWTKITRMSEWLTSVKSSEFVRYVVTPQGVEKHTHYILFKLSDLSPEMKAILFDENGEPRELVVDHQRYRQRILEAAGCL